MTEIPSESSPAEPRPDGASSSGQAVMNLSRGVLFNVIIPLVLLVGGGTLVVLFGTAEPQKRPDPDTSPSGLLRSLPPARVAKLQSLDSTGEELELEVDGVVVPFQEARVAAEVSGRIVFKAEACEAGSYVKAGQLLMRIDNSSYLLEVYRLFQLVKQEQQDFENTEKLIDVAQQDVKLQQAEVERLGKLAELGKFASYAEIDQAKRVLLAAQQQLVSVQNQADLLRQRKIAVEAQLYSAISSLLRTEVRAPIEGVIVSEQADLNTFVSLGSSLVTIDNTSKVEVASNIRMDQLHWVLDQANPVSHQISDQTSGKNLNVSQRTDERVPDARVADGLIANGLITDTPVSDGQGPGQQDQFGSVTELDFGFAFPRGVDDFVSDADLKELYGYVMKVRSVESGLESEIQTGSGDRIDREERVNHQDPEHTECPDCPTRKASGPGYALPKTKVIVEFVVNGRDDTVHRWNGHLLSYDGIGLDPETRTVPVRVVVDRPQQLVDENGTPLEVDPSRIAPALLRGMYVRVRLQLKPRKPLLVIPANSLQPGNRILQFLPDEQPIAGPLARSVADSAAVSEAVGDQADFDPQQWRRGSVIMQKAIYPINPLRKGSLNGSDEKQWVCEVPESSGLSGESYVIVSPMGDVGVDREDVGEKDQGSGAQTLMEVRVKLEEMTPQSGDTRAASPVEPQVVTFSPEEGA